MSSPLLLFQSLCKHIETREAGKHLVEECVREERRQPHTPGRLASPGLCWWIAFEEVVHRILRSRFQRLSDAEMLSSNGSFYFRFGRLVDRPRRNRLIVSSIAVEIGMY